MYSRAYSSIRVAYTVDREQASVALLVDDEVMGEITPLGLLAPAPGVPDLFGAGMGGGTDGRLVVLFLLLVLCRLRGSLRVSSVLCVLMGRGCIGP